ncbi:M20 aminoacylase family protein [Sabulicella glaciei]|uniref:M20 family metallopeptidase n=1 Tax=Sabulicella glaciei TaxID=2984948 RepID=A0ABT3NRV9_9PROT|nr:M20 aminoacylase family protein [Roseococcus sp. MDT2-1-1]MCW8084899.1 M20 family metallopeptidase [Roseococcus sp. MDT2-1-1]
MPVPNRLADLQPEMAEWRQDIHAHPELGYEEQRTSDLVAAKLAEWGIEVHRGLGVTGLVGVLRNGDSGRSVGLRADMDCLPMNDESGAPYASTVPGKAHACGHDGHTTMLLGAAKYLAETRNFDGTVHFIFQPAEEGGAGARAMIQDGLFGRFPCDKVFGVHNDPNLKLGEAAVVSGPVLAASDRVNIFIKGIGGHAARPHQAVDPIVVGAQIVVAMQAIVARRVDPLDSAVISLCQFHAGSASNVIPETAEIRGTVRTLRPGTQDEMERLITQTAKAIGALNDAEVTVEYVRGYPPTVNDEAETERAALAAAKVVGQERVIRKRPPNMGGEDFSFMLLERPGCFVKLGQDDGARGGVALHNPKYDFNDALLPIGAGFFAALVEQELPRG